MSKSSRDHNDKSRTVEQKGSEPDMTNAMHTQYSGFVFLNASLLWMEIILVDINKANQGFIRTFCYAERWESKWLSYPT